MLHAWLVASPLHWPRIKNRRVGDIVALIDAALTQARRVGSNPAITPAPVTAAAAPPSGGPLFRQPTVQHEAGRFAPRRSRTRTPRAFLPSGECRWSAGKAAGGSASPGSVTTWWTTLWPTTRPSGSATGSFSPWFRAMPPAVNPQKLQNPLDEDVLAVVRALARLRARIDHEAEIARRSVQARATEPSA